MINKKFIVFGAVAVLTATALVFSVLTRNSEQTDGHGMHMQHDKQNGVVSVDVKYVDGAVDLLVGKKRGGQTLIWYQTSTDQAKSWSKPVNITANIKTPANVKRGNDARLAVQGNNLIAVWTSEADDMPYHAGPMQAVRSQDGGKSWQAAAIPADWHGAHGFFAIDANSHAFDLVWLDSRGHEQKGSQGLRFSQTLDAGLSWSPNITLDHVTCACCWNTAKFAEDGNLFVVYRDKHPSDMAIGRVDRHNKWQRLATVGQFNWDFNGCPHAGAGLAFDHHNHYFYATVATGYPDRAGLYFLRSVDQGRNWSQPQQLGSSTAIHSDIAVAENGVVAAVWDQLGDNGFQVFYASSDDQGQSWSQPMMLSNSNDSADHPRIMAMDNRFLILWTRNDNGNITLKMTTRPFKMSTQ